MENNRIKPVDVASELSTSFLDYSMSVIISRALPDVRDGLKIGRASCRERVLRLV